MPILRRRVLRQDKSVPAAPIPPILDGEAGEVAENVTALGSCGATTIEEEGRRRRKTPDVHKQQTA